MKSQIDIKTDGRQAQALERLALRINPRITMADGYDLLRALRLIESRVNRKATDYCNGDISEEIWEAESEKAKKKITNLFGASVPFLYINGDPRGYSLKIDNETEDGQKLINEIGLYRDWGGYGILAPAKDAR